MREKSPAVRRSTSQPSDEVQSKSVRSYAAQLPKAICQARGPRYVLWRCVSVFMGILITSLLRKGYIGTRVKSMAKIDDTAFLRALHSIKRSYSYWNRKFGITNLCCWILCLLMSSTLEIEEEENSEQNIDDAPILESAKSDIGEKVTPSENGDSPKTQVKWWVWTLLIAALFAVSSAATGLRKLKNVPPLMKASWRLQCTSIILFIGFVYHLYKLLYHPRTDTSSTIKDPEFTPEVKAKYFTPKTFGILLLSGTALAIHFGCWVASLDETSLAHSLLFVTCHPILIVLGLLVLRRPISKGEVLGAVTGFIGLVITLLDTLFNPSEGEDAPSFFGDFLAFLGALAIIVYLYAGKTLRSWVSLYMYAFPVTFISAVWLGAVSSIFEKKPSPIEGESYGLFGWSSTLFILVIVYLAIVPGFVGHTGINAIIKYLDPVVISVTLLMEPVIGSFMGYFAGVSALPGLYTFLGGPVIIAGCVWVTVAAHKRTQTNKYVQLKERAGEEMNSDTEGETVEMQDLTKDSN